MLFQRLWKLLKTGGRIFKNALLRPFRSIAFKIKRSTNLSRQMTKGAPKVAKGISKVKLKPKAREDYIETKNAYVAKPLVIVLILGALVLAALIYFVGWPLLQSWFFVAHMPASSEDAKEYSGRVVLYYDEEKTLREYEGKLKEGFLSGNGKEFHQNGTLKYDGSFFEGKYSGSGKLYNEEGKLIYDGTFLNGVYSGQGILYEDEVRVYQGNFSEGVYDGTGAEYINGDIKVYEGGYSAGVRSGMGKVYSDGILIYQGGYQGTSYSGDGKTFYKDGTIASEGTFSNGLLAGSGTDYYEKGSVKYRGTFSLGEYEGTGSLYREDGSLEYKGDFSLGVFEGTGTLYYEDGKSKRITGDFTGGEPSGENVTVYDTNGRVVYKGGYEAGKYSGEGKLLLGNDSWIEGIFTEGQAAGSVKMYSYNRLVYEGGYVNGAYSGAGKLYNEIGDVLFSGNFVNGVPDLSVFLGQTKEQIFTLFGEGNYTEYQKDDGYLIVGTKCKLAAFTCFPAEDEESVVHRMYFYDDAFLWEYTLSELPLPEEGEAKSGKRRLVKIDGIDEMDGRSCYSRRLSTKKYYFTAWSDLEDGPVICIEYKSTTPLPTLVPPVETAAAATS